MIDMRKSIGIILLAAVMCLQACDKNVFYAAERDVDESGWNMKEPVVFDVNIEDTLQVYDFFIDVFGLDRQMLDESKITIEPDEMLKSLYK